MPKITKTIKKRGGKTAVWMDGRYFGTVQGEYETGFEPDAEQLSQMLASRGQTATEAAFALLGKRIYTEKEMRQALRKKFFPEEDVERALAYLKEGKYIDDGDYASLYASRAAASLKSSRQIRFELRQKGIPQEIIDAAAESSDDESEEEKARALAEKWRRTHRTGDERALKRSLYSYLARRGFDYSVVSSIIGEEFDE